MRAAGIRVRNYVEHWPVTTHSRTKSPISLFAGRTAESATPFSLVEPHEIKKNPDVEFHDGANAEQDCSGFAYREAHDQRGRGHRPGLYWFGPQTLSGGRCARLCGQGLGIGGPRRRDTRPSAVCSEVTYCLKPDETGNLTLDRDQLRVCRKPGDSAVLVYGFTYILWKYLVKPLIAEIISLGMPGVHILHSGGWKLLQEEAVDKKSFNDGLAQRLRCSPAIG